MFLLPPNVFWSFQAVLSIPINKFTPTWVSPDVLSLPSFSHSIRIYDGNYLPFSCLGSDRENFQATDGSLLSVPVLGLPHGTQEPQQQGKPCCATSLLVWRGHTVELALTQCQHQKLQRQNPSKNRLFKDLNQQTPKSFYWACANWNFSKLDFQRNSNAGAKAVHLPKTFSRTEDLTQKFSGSSQHGPNYLFSSYLFLTDMSVGLVDTFWKQDFSFM